MIGDNDEINLFDIYISEKQYTKEIPENGLLVFGTKIGTGGDQDNFQCGFTSVKLLKRIEEFNNQGNYQTEKAYCRTFLLVFYKIIIKILRILYHLKVFIISTQPTKSLTFLYYGLTFFL